MKKVLLTGASGFVGRQCLSALARRGYEVHAVFLKHRLAAATGVDLQWHQTDLLDRDQVRSLMRQLQPTHLLHTAWYAEPGKYWEAAENFLWAEASADLFHEFQESGGRRAVGVGTCAEYDWNLEFCKEGDTPLRPATTYGTCKLKTGTLLTELNSARFHAAWARLFFLYGPHEDERRLVAAVIKSLLADEAALCSHGEQIRDFLHVQDAADALVALLDSDVSGPVNIASGLGVEVREVVREIATQLGKPHLLRLGARPAGANEPTRLLADVTRLRDEVRWSPNYDLRRGLAETIEWWKGERDQTMRPAEAGSG